MAPTSNGTSAAAASMLGEPATGDAGAPANMATSGPSTARTAAPSALHARICVSPTAPIPSTFPIISSNGRTLEAITSTIRFCFSSITPRITIAP